jgi:hypothetical protein
MTEIKSVVLMNGDDDDILDEMEELLEDVR